MDRRALPTRVQVVVVPDTCRQDAGISTCAVPVVIVLSEYDPSELAVHVPVTWRDSVSVAVAQPRSAGTMFTLPLTFRQKDVTDQVPTTVPTQGVTLVQVDPPPPVALLPPVEFWPPVAATPPVALEPPVVALPPVDDDPPPATALPPVDDNPPTVAALPPVKLALPPVDDDPPTAAALPPVALDPPVVALPPVA